MDSSKLAVKFYVKDASSLATDAFIPVFHSWIQTHALPDHLLIDVADYKHVESGPGTVLVAHQANLSMDSAGGRLGLLYARKQPIAGDLAERLRLTFRSALAAASLLEKTRALDGNMAFRTDDPVFRIYDRLLAPNTTETFAIVRPMLESFLAKLYGGPVKLNHEPIAETAFEVRIGAGSTPSITDLLQRL